MNPEHYTEGYLQLSRIWAYLMATYWMQLHENDPKRHDPSTPLNQAFIILVDAAREVRRGEK